MKKEYRLTEAETEFAELIWANEPVSSTALVHLCAEAFAWKKSTTYTMLKNLCEKGVFQNENATVSSVMKKEDFYGKQSREYVNEVFGGSLPRFLTAFCGGRKLTAAEVAEMRRLIDEADV
ncbi:MAG: BlaI/MecI/CopY family transcriptional regulator [Lachnospiraceae bacterium]|nr:BlaI/MecI/CopY family transcriptional regulator [Lachnospiraceae bacterium]